MTATPRRIDRSGHRRSTLPTFIKPQLSRLVREAPDGPDWTHKYQPIAGALAALPVTQAYLDGELSGVRPDGTTSFAIIQAASDSRNADNLIFSCSTCCSWMARI